MTPKEAVSVIHEHLGGKKYESPTHFRDAIVTEAKAIPGRPVESGKEVWIATGVILGVLRASIGTWHAASAEYWNAYAKPEPPEPEKPGWAEVPRTILHEQKIRRVSWHTDTPGQTELRVLGHNRGYVLVEKRLRIRTECGCRIITEQHFDGGDSNE